VSTTRSGEIDVYADAAVAAAAVIGAGAVSAVAGDATAAVARVHAAMALYARRRRTERARVRGVGVMRGDPFWGLVGW
jgi:hypothetical protein